MVSRRSLCQQALAAAVIAALPRRSFADTSDPYGAAWDLIEAGEFGAAARFLEPNPAAARSLETRVVRAGALYFAAGDFMSAVQCFDVALSAPARAGESDIIENGPSTFLLLRDAKVWRYLAAARRGEARQWGADDVALILSPPTRLVTGLIDLDAYVEEELAKARVYYDALILNVAEWKGKEGFVSRLMEPLANGYRCVGNFALGELALAKGDHARARTFFASAAATNASDLVEYHTAKAELARLA